MEAKAHFFQAFGQGENLAKLLCFPFFFAFIFMKKDGPARFV